MKFVVVCCCILNAVSLVVKASSDVCVDEIPVSIGAMAAAAADTPVLVCSKFEVHSEFASSKPVSVFTFGPFVKRPAFGIVDGTSPNSNKK